MGTREGDRRRGLVETWGTEGGGVDLMGAVGQRSFKADSSVSECEHAFWRFIKAGSSPPALAPSISVHVDFMSAPSPLNRDGCCRDRTFVADVTHRFSDRKGVRG